jgi:hypothetical protein
MVRLRVARGTKPECRLISRAAGDLGFVGGQRVDFDREQMHQPGADSAA